MSNYHVVITLPSWSVGKSAISTSRNPDVQLESGEYSLGVTTKSKCNAGSPQMTLNATRFAEEQYPVDIRFVRTSVTPVGFKKTVADAISRVESFARRTLRLAPIGAIEHAMLTSNAVHVRVIATSDVVILSALESVENSASLALSRVLGSVSIGDNATCLVGRHADDFRVIFAVTAFLSAVINVPQFAVKFVLTSPFVKNVAQKT